MKFLFLCIFLFSTVALSDGTKRNTGSKNSACSDQLAGKDWRGGVYTGSDTHKAILARQAQQAQRSAEQRNVENLFGKPLTELPRN